MSRHEETCPHCRAKQAGEAEPVAVAGQEIVMPAVPTPIRVHQPDRPPFDCTLHPDGTLTAVLGGEVRRNFFTFDDMRETNWATAHFEIDPPPLVEEPAPEAAVEAVQEALIA